MTLADFLDTIAKSYDRKAPMSAPAQLLLRNAQAHLDGYVPGGIVIRGSGGKGTATHTPWVGFFDPDETETPESGIYVVYLFAADFGHLTLSVMQGITKLTQELGAANARMRLTHDADVIRNAMQLPAGWEKAMALSSSGFRQRAYEAGTIAAKTYALEKMPADSVLATDLGAALEIYERAIEAKRFVLQAQPGEVSTPSVLQQQGDPSQNPLADFKPKSADDYVAQLAGRVLVKSRRHERLINEYSAWAKSHGYQPSSEHPIDLVLRRSGQTWLVEGKVVYGGNANDAVRAALGQLYTYRHFLYAGQQDLHLLALFTEPIGEAFVGFLEVLGIAVVWKGADEWAGSQSLVQLDLAGALKSLVLATKS